MNLLPLALALSLTLSLPFSPAAASSAAERQACPTPESVEFQAAAIPEISTVYPSSPKGAPVTYELHLPVLMYHHVVYDWQECNEMTITTGRLERDLRWLAENGYQTVLPRELAAGEPLPEKPVLITFDDGYQSNYYLAYPLLQKYRAKAAIAVMAYMQDNPGGNFLTWDMCREMAASGLVEIGSHGYVIHNLDIRMGNFVPGQANGVQRRKGESDLDFQCRVLEDLRYSHERITVELGTPPTYFAYPFGKTDPDADAYLKTLFPLTVVTGPGKHAANLSKGLQQLPRFTVTMQHTPAELLKNV
jgi:biofilm PGA synthesis lipoprotein PgaB